MRDKLGKLMALAKRDAPKEAKFFKIVNSTVIFYRGVREGTHDKMVMPYDYEWYTKRTSAPCGLIEL